MGNPTRESLLMAIDDDLFAEIEKTLKAEQQAKPEANHVVIRTLFQKTVMKIFPNGNVSIDKAQSSSWFKDSKEMWKKKPKKKAKKIEQPTLQQAEEY